MTIELKCVPTFSSPSPQDMMISTAMYGTACGLREQVPFSANEVDERLVDHKGWSHNYSSFLGVLAGHDNRVSCLGVTEVTVFSIAMLLVASRSHLLRHFRMAWQWLLVPGILSWRFGTKVEEERGSRNTFLGCDLRTMNFKLSKKFEWSPGVRYLNY